MVQSLTSRLAFGYNRAGAATATTVQAATFAAARLLAEPADGTLLTTPGRDTVNDGLGGTFAWDSSSTTADDNTNTIKITSVTTGRWVRISGDNALVLVKTGSVNTGRGIYGLQAGSTVNELAVQDVVNSIRSELELSDRVFNVRGYGAASTSSATANVTAISAAIAALTAAGGGVLLFPEDSGGAYTINVALALPSNCVVDGRGTIDQTAAATAVFTATSKSDITIRGITITGVGGATYAADEHGISFTSCSDVTIDGVIVHTLAGHPVYLTACTDSTVQNCTIHTACSGIRLRGCARVDVIGNTLRDPASAIGTFIGGIFLDSDDGHAYSYCTDVTIDHNTVKGYKNSQSIEVHAGERITIGGGNRLYDVGGVGVSVNPYTVTDRCRGIAIGPMVIELTSTAGGASENFGISMQGGAAGATTSDAGYYIDDVTIGAVVIRNANNPTAATKEGAGIILQKVRGVSLAGPVCAGCYGSGLWLAGEVYALSGHLSVRDVNVGNSRASAVIVSGGTANTVMGRLTVNADDAGQGVQYDTSATGLEIDFGTLNNVTTRVGNQTSGRVDGVGGYTAAATTIDVSRGVSYVYVANAAPTTITNLTNSYTGQRVTLVFADANTTIDRSNAVLAGAASFTSTQYATLTLVRGPTYWHEVCRETTNG